MPNIEEHCARTMKRYGVEGRDIHSWLDEPSKEYAVGHRQFRHDTETVRLAGEIFGKTYGKSLAENIALDHIMLDHEDEIKKRADIVVRLPDEKEIPTIPCIYCSTLLRPSDQFCPNCGASRTKIIEDFDRIREMEKLRLNEKKKSLQRELQRELKLEEALREFTPEYRAEATYIWRPFKEWEPEMRARCLSETAGERGYTVDPKIVLPERYNYPGALKGISKKSALEIEDLWSSIFDEEHRKSEENDGKSEEEYELLIEKVRKLGLADKKLETSNNSVIERLMREDFERHPELREYVDGEIERRKSIFKKIKETRAAEEARIQAKKSKLTFNLFKRRT